MTEDEYEPAAGAFTRVELASLLFIFGLLALLLVSGLARKEQRAKEIRCVSNLATTGLSFKTWALDNGDHFPTEVDAGKAGSRPMEYFQLLSNSLVNPRILICPADTRKPATNLTSGFTHSNLSYFVGLDARDTNPNTALMGDRNVTNGPLNGPLPATRILVLDTNFPVNWTREMHRYQGNIGLADGSVQQFSSASLGAILQNNRLLMP